MRNGVGRGRLRRGDKSGGLVKKCVVGNEDCGLEEFEE